MLHRKYIFRVENPVVYNLTTANINNLAEITRWRQIGVGTHPYNDELERLTEDPGIKERLEKTKKLRNGFFDTTQQISFCRSLEVFNIFREKYYVFNHGQMAKWYLPINLLTKNMIDIELSCYETFMRHPQQIVGINHDVDYYTNNIIPKNRSVHNDRIYTKELISADAHLGSVIFGESAIRCFLARGSESTRLTNDDINSMTKLSSNYDEFIREFSRVQDIIYNLEYHGILYTICVNKDYFNQCGYLSLPGGQEYPESRIRDKEILEILQDSVNIVDYGPLPQVRLLTHKLDPKYTKVFIFSNMVDHQLVLANCHIKRVVQKFF